MAGWDDVARIALSLPETTETLSRGNRQWLVAGKGFVWERPLRRTDRLALGDGAPTGPILGVRVADLGVKEALIADTHVAFFTTPHFNGYPAILVELDKIEPDDLVEVIVDAWLCRAPRTLANAYLAAH
jgi:hypothetical protein